MKLLDRLSHAVASQPTKDLNAAVNASLKAHLGDPNSFAEIVSDTTASVKWTDRHGVPHEEFFRDQGNGEVTQNQVH